MPVVFYLPEKYLPEPARQVAWKERKMHALEETGKIASVQCWVYQTMVELELAGMRVDHVPEIPSEGIVIAFGGTLGQHYQPPEGVFLVDIVADDMPREGAHLHIIQNRAHARRMPNSVFIPLWTQPYLIPRDHTRGDRFETVAFFGAVENLAPELNADWQKRLKEETGLNFEVRGAARWHDYSDVDCVIGIRDFQDRQHFHKPATKLYNAWLADVPFVGGRESAHRADGESGKDCVLISTVDELTDQLKKLSQSPEKRRQIVAEGKKKGADFTPAATAERWKKLIQQDLPRLAEEEKRKSGLRRATERLVRKGVTAVDRVFRS